VAALKETWGRFTAGGSPEVEARITALLEEVAQKGKRILGTADCRALVLIGGYGRGEGGVEIVDGQERPHNNLDLLLITNDLSPAEQGRLKEEFQEALVPLTQTYGIEIVVGTTTVSKLGDSPSLVMWYDMRFGHRTILGDAAFVPSLTHFQVERIPEWDVHNLLVNRGTLLVFNDHLIEAGRRDEDARKLIVRHAMKAIIGYGDALLFFLGDYHWSYVEKQRRMRARAEVPEAFRALYDEAIEFRFYPAYSTYLERDPAAWMNALRDTFSLLHLVCESKRLRSKGLNWENYPEILLQRALFEDFTSSRAWVKKMYHFVGSSACPIDASLVTKAGYRVLGGRGLIPLVFPVVGYRLEIPRFVRLAERALGARGTAPRELRRAYLVLWSRVGDINCSSMLRKWQISLDPGESGS